ncbi:hypothetical protein bcgnr5401_00600 [Bacillus cereus]
MIKSQTDIQTKEDNQPQIIGDYLSFNRLFLFSLRSCNNYIFVDKFNATQKAFLVCNIELTLFTFSNKHKIHR